MQIKGTLLVAAGFSPRPRIVMARIAGSTFFRRDGGAKWIHAGSIKKVRTAEFRPEEQYNKLLAQANSISQCELALENAKYTPEETVTRETSEEECLWKVWHRILKAEQALSNAKAAEAIVREGKAPEEAKKLSREAREKFAKLVTPILEAQRKLAFEQHGDALCDHVKFEVVIGEPVAA